MWSAEETNWMRRAIEIARNGIGSVSPNPLVGCVIVKDGVLIGEGAHLMYGGPHAEVNAVATAERAGHSLFGSTVFVTLEPCAHHGRTPPCADLLVAKGIAKCVIATVDRNPKVVGGGAEVLRAAGIEVEVGLLQREAEDLARFFIKHVITGKPYVTLKFGMSIDGRTALANGESQWITSEASRARVHAMRAEYDAVLIGSGTALMDDPSLTVRMAQGRQPERFVIDGALRLPETLKLFNDEYSNLTTVITIADSLENSPTKAEFLRKQGVKIVVVPKANSADNMDLSQAMLLIGTMGVQGVMIEAGANLAAAAIRSGIVDEIAAFVAPIVLGGDAQPAVGQLGLTSLSESPNFYLQSLERVEGTNDLFLRYRKTAHKVDGAENARGNEHK